MVLEEYVSRAAATYQEAGRTISDVSARIAIQLIQTLSENPPRLTMGGGALTHNIGFARILCGLTSINALVDAHSGLFERFTNQTQVHDPLQAVVRISLQVSNNLIFAEFYQIGDIEDQGLSDQARVNIQEAKNIFNLVHQQAVRAKMEPMAYLTSLAIQPAT